MSIFLAFFLALAPAPAPQEKADLSSIVAGVEQSFAHMSDYSSDFVQIFQDPLNRKQQEAGHVYLKRSRMMRWEYKSPEEKYFISDGKTVYFYVPADKQVNKEAVKDTFDDRMPLMFLLGRSDLQSEFTQFELLNTKPFLEGTKVVRMTPKRKTDLKELIMEVDPANYQIRRLLLAHADGSRAEFVFSNIRINTGVKASLFDFKVPPGVQVVAGIGQ
jgi:outer membrane lipoprotein carrier protein